MEEWYDYIIAGLSAAGFYALEKLKQIHPDASILAVSAEKHLPYKRTAIDKKWPEWDSGSSEEDLFLLAERSWYRENHIHLMTGCRIASIDQHKKFIKTRTGETYHFGKLLLAVGSNPFKPSYYEFEEAYTVRTLSDSLALRRAALNSSRSLVYGLGVEGVELAVQLRQMGLDVTLAGRSNRLMSSRFSDPFSERIESLLFGNGIDICFNISLEELDTHDSLVVFSIGIVPETQMASAAGLECRKGIVVDSHLRTSCPDIYAAGDCAEHSGGFCSGLWHEAQDQGRIAAENMCGGNTVYSKTERRMKTELFNGYYFSFVPSGIRENSAVEIRNIKRPGNALVHLYLLDGRTAGVEMADDSDSAKIYEKAVLENLPVEELLKSLDSV